jgi:ubiquinone/menaquinone biosynthesis C-methylase UbiE
LLRLAPAPYLHNVFTRWRIVMCSRWRMGQVTAATAAPDEITYLDAAAGTAVGLEYKQRLLAALDLRPRQTAIDIGCGPGTDLRRLADAVGAGGRVIGVDREARMLNEARRRLAERANVNLHLADIHNLPLPDRVVDRARVDRVLQHALDPAKAMAEIRRVLQPGGLFGIAEPDWDSVAVADEDIVTSRRFAEFLASRVRNATIGRELVRLCVRAGMRVRSVEPVAVLFRDFDTADQILGLRRNAARAVLAGKLAEGDADAWVRRLAGGPVVAGFTFYLVIAEA